MNPPRTSPHLLLKRLLRLGLAAVLVTAVVFGVLGIMPAQAITPTNGMSASLVLGQANFTSNSPATTQTGMTNPTGIAVDPTTSKVFVADYINSRILRFASVASLSNGAAAEAVLGQPNFTSNALTTTQNGMWNPQDVYVDSAGRLWVADEGNHRVLRFDSAASKANGANADGVLGQADFTSRNAATTQDGMKFPGAVVVDSSGHLWVKDQDNHRVLRFDNAASKLNGANADGVLGQADFVSAVQGPTQNRMRYPRHIAVDSGGRLWVADNGSRVLRFDDAASKANGANADGVLGQVDFTSAVYATTQTGMNNTAGIAIDNTGRLYESELNSNRVLVFNNAASLGNGAPADNVLGQMNFTSGGSGLSATQLNQPFGMFYDPTADVLWVADSLNNRVVAYSSQNALDFDGANDYVDIPSIPALNDFTLEYWLYSRSPDLTYDRITENGTDVFDTAKDGSGNINVYGIGLGWTPVTSTPLNTWTHLAFVRSGTTLTIYRNGTQVYINNSVATTPLATQWYLGTTFWGTEDANMILDEVRIWNVARGQPQIAANMNGEVSPQAGLVAYYHFNQGVANGNNVGITTALDSSGAGRNGTLNNFALIGSTSNWVNGMILGAVDSIGPTVDSFTATSPSYSLNIPITAFTASDNVGVTGYLITTSATPPLPGDSGWAGTAPTTYAVGGLGTYTLYPWARDAAGNVSVVYGSPASVTVCSSSITVMNSNNSGAGSLRQAIADVCAGGTISFSGDYAILLASTLTIDKNVAIDGAGHGVTVDGQNAVRVLYVNLGITVTLKGLTIANGSTGIGAGVYNEGTLTVLSSTLSGNTASSYGGGIYSEGALTVANSTFSGNTAPAGYGGGLHNSGPVTVTASTFSGNSNGILNGGFGTLNLINTIIANSTNSDCASYGTIGTEKNNLIEGTGSNACGLVNGTNSDVIGSDPNLGSLTGSPAYFPLNTGSPAIDAGNDATCTAAPVNNLDQRGVTRPQGAHCDIGSYEYVPPPPLCFATIDGTTIYSSNDAQAVRDAVTAASAGGTVKIAGYCAGVSGGQVVNLTKVLTLTGGYTTTNWTTYNPTANATTLDAQGGGRVIYANVAATLQGFTLTNGVTGGNGGGLYAAGALTLTQVSVYSNTATNASNSQGAGAFINGVAQVSGSTFLSNTCAAYAGGAWFQTDATVINSTFTQNRANGSGGGGAWFQSGSAAVIGTTFLSNTAVSQGGGGLFYGTASITNTSFVGNTGITGGGARFGASTSIISSTFINNTSASNGGGGGASFAALANVANTSFVGNTAYEGGGAHFQSDANVTGTTFSNNQASFTGGAWFQGGTANVAGTTFLGNASANYAGGMRADATLALTNTHFLSNTASTYGGGVLLYGAASMSGVTFLGNTAGNYGGGVYFSGANAKQLVNVLFARNRAATNGAALYVVDSTPLRILHATIVSPTLPTGAAEAVYVAGGTVNVIDTIVASQTTGIQRAGGTVTADNTLFYGNTTNTAGSVTNNNPVSGNPQFVDPTNDNYHIGADSAAVDAGINAGVTTDIDGDTRSQGIGYDIGYDEVLQQCGLSANTDYVLGSPTVALSFNALGDANCVAAVYFPRAHPNATGTVGHGVGQDRFWQIAARNNAGATATGFTAAITLPYSSFTSPTICFYPGAMGGYGWDCLGVQSYNGSLITRQGLTHFSDWAVGNNTGPTAVGLRSLRAESVDRTSARFAPIGLGALLLILSGVALVINRKRRQSSQR